MFPVIITYPPCLVNSQDGISLCPVQSIQHFILANNRGCWIEAMVDWLSVISVRSALDKNPRTSLPYWTDKFNGIEASYSSIYFYHKPKRCSSDTPAVLPEKQTFNSPLTRMHPTHGV